MTPALAEDRYSALNKQVSLQMAKTWNQYSYHMHNDVGWLFWGLTSQSTIFQSYRDGAIASWVINQYFRGVKCLAQGHNTAAVGLEPRTSRSGVRHSTTELCTMKQSVSYIAIKFTVYEKMCFIFNSYTITELADTFIVRGFWFGIPTSFYCKG